VAITAWKTIPPTADRSCLHTASTSNHRSSCPDISLAISKLAQFNQDPTTTHLNAARRVFKCVISATHFAIKYGGDEEYRIDGYADTENQQRDMYL
jgi:hypothetical protein